MSDQEEDMSYKQQIRAAMSLESDVDEEGNDIPLTWFDFVVHFLTFFWKVRHPTHLVRLCRALPYLLLEGKTSYLLSLNLSCISSPVSGMQDIPLA